MYHEIFYHVIKRVKTCFWGLAFELPRFSPGLNPCILELLTIFAGFFDSGKPLTNH